MNQSIKQSPNLQLIPTRPRHQKQVPERRAVLVANHNPSQGESMRQSLQDAGYDVLLTQNGEDALQAIYASHQNMAALVLDYTLDGLNMLCVIRGRHELNLIPIIMSLPKYNITQICRSLDGGAHYFLAASEDDGTLLKTLIATAIREFAFSRRKQTETEIQQHGMQLLDTARYTFSTLDEGEALAALLSTCYPDPKRALIGISELLINAVEHGNLGVSYEEKTRLVTAGTWRETVDARQKLPEYCNRKVEVVLQRKPDGIYFQVSDEGPGFEWWRYLEMDPARAIHPNGRGIALANKIAFDRLQFTNNGSRALGVVHIQAQQPQSLSW